MEYDTEENAMEEIEPPYAHLTPAIPIEPQQMIDSNSSMKEILQEDVEHMNNALKAVYQSWHKANTISKVCKLAMTQAFLVTQRRRLLLKPVSYKEHKEFHSTKKRPLDFEVL